MKTTLPITNVFARARRKASTFMKALSRRIRTSQKSAGADAEQSIEEFERLSGSGHSDGWRFDRDEVHQRR
jgi:hypothetical protein